jgi:hypothetical protein
MRLLELMEENESKMPHVFLDMDGVQADFSARGANVRVWITGKRLLTKSLT